jgi:hypothetical protein
VHRDHATVETAGSAPPRPWAYATPSRTWQVNVGWVIAANIAVGLAAWTRLLGHCDHEELRDADLNTLCYRIWHIPARERVLKISPTGRGKRPSSPAGTGSAPCLHPPDQHEPPPDKKG